MNSLRLIIEGAPRTKKNHGRLVGTKTSRPRMLPSKPWEAWCKTAVPMIRMALDRIGHTAIAQPVNCRAVFYRETACGDAVGFYQGLADVLEAARVVVNDVWIVSWDGSRLLKDAGRPRVEIEITPFVETIR